MAVPGSGEDDHPLGAGTRKSPRPRAPSSGQMRSGPPPRRHRAACTAAASAARASPSGSLAGPGGCAWDRRRRAGASRGSAAAQPAPAGGAASRARWPPGRPGGRRSPGGPCRLGGAPGGGDDPGAVRPPGRAPGRQHDMGAAAGPAARPHRPHPRLRAVQQPDHPLARKPPRRQHPCPHGQAVRPAARSAAARAASAHSSTKGHLPGHGARLPARAARAKGQPVLQPARPAPPEQARSPGSPRNDSVNIIRTTGWPVTSGGPAALTMSSHTTTGMPAGPPGSVLTANVARPPPTCSQREAGDSGPGIVPCGGGPASGMCVRGQARRGSGFPSVYREGEHPRNGRTSSPNRQSSSHPPPNRRRGWPPHGPSHHRPRTWCSCSPATL